LSISSLYCRLFLFFSYSPRHHRPLPSFPTRRSSDLDRCRSSRVSRATRLRPPAGAPPDPDAPSTRAPRPRMQRRPVPRSVESSRSEEHTSELQSRENLVCRLLLEKKKKKHINTRTLS